MSERHEGGCLCGALRIAAAAPPESICYCHCRLCQRSSGAPVLAWASFPAASFRYLSGTPQRYASSAHGEREFCGHCGTQLLFRSAHEPDLVDLNVGAMDQPERYRPTHHIHCASAIAWLAEADTLPRYPGRRAD
jgi:hypothetical protein